MIDRIPRSGLLLSVAALCAAEFPFLVPSEMTRIHRKSVLRRPIHASIYSGILFAAYVDSGDSWQDEGIADRDCCSDPFHFQCVPNSKLEPVSPGLAFAKVALLADLLEGPGSKAGTSVFVYGLPKSLRGNHAAGLLNMLYDRDDKEGTLNYFIFDLSQLSEPLTGFNLSYKPGVLLKSQVRTYPYQGNTSQSLVAWISPGGTFRVLSQPDANQILRCPAICMNTSQLSKPERTYQLRRNGVGRCLRYSARNQHLNGRITIRKLSLRDN